MKKLLVIVIATLVISAVKCFGQGYKPALTKGSVLIGGAASLGFGSSQSEYSSSFGTGDSKSSYFQISGTPKAIFFLANGIGLGVMADVTSISAKDADDTDSEYTTTQYSLGPVFRYYAPFGLFAHGDFSFGKYKEKYSDSFGSETDESTLTKWNIGVGYAAFVNDFVSIEPSIMYSSARSKSSDADFKSTTTLGQFMVGVGISVFIGKKS
jgi:hypothetical protein